MSNKQKKSVKNGYGIKTKGFWEVREKDKDQEREAKRQKADSRQRGQTLEELPATTGFAAISSHVSTMLKPKPKLTRAKTDKKTNKILAGMEDLHVSSEDVFQIPDMPTRVGGGSMSVQSVAETPDAKQAEEPLKAAKKEKPKKEKFQYMSLSHLNILFEVLQQHYMWSVRDKKEKEHLKKKEPELFSSPLYHDFCSEDQPKHLNRSTEYRIKINNRVYRLSWWNSKGRRVQRHLIVHRR